MESVEFWKMNGSGNDFILIDNRNRVIAEKDMQDVVKKACRRRESVGADGLIFIINSGDFDFAWRFFNSDGSEAEMCGNGGRCVARFAYLKGIAGPRMTFGTMAGPVSAEVEGRTVKVLMPEPFDLKTDIDLSIEDGWKSVDFINTGVPHVVIRLEDLENLPILEQGRLIRNHSAFSPQGTNVNFIKVTGNNSLEVRTYERGVEDETLACGTGSIAAALMACKRELVDSPVKVKTRGGEELTIYFREESHSFYQVWLEGSTSISYKGELHREALE
ncbi:diaminopimelate epimerase [Thermodesulfobacteriota bacterium]